jgi:glutaredoxin
MKYHVVTRPSCPRCNLAKALISGHGFEYTEEVLDTPMKVAAFKARQPGARTVPAIFVEDTLIGGWNELKDWFDADEVAA